MKSASVLALVGAPLLASAYSLKDDYLAGNAFASKFSYWTTTDPTKGYVNFVDKSTAQNEGLLRQNGQVFIGVDNSTIVSSNKRGRDSLRITSNAVYHAGTLIVADLAHMPGGECGTWPAFWTTSSEGTWPQNGEIDIVEEVLSNTNQMSLHVSNKNGSCTIASNPSMTANPDRWPDCTQEGNSGCDANDPRTNTFGAGFNNNGGGVYAMEWTHQHIRVYFWPRNGIPSGSSGPLGSSPDPTTWGTPATAFEGGSCNLDNHIKDQRIVIDTTFCGAWAGDSGWNSWLGCGKKTGSNSCEDWVANHPEGFDEAYWLFNSLKVYT